MIRFSALLFALLATCVSFAQSPYLVKDINTTNGGYAGSSNPSGFVADGGAVYFSAAQYTNYTPVLWRFANGQLVKLENSQWQPQSPVFLFPKGDGTYYFTAKQGSPASGLELWRTDGTPEGTMLLKDIYPGSSHSTPQQFLVHQGLLYFTATHPTTGREVWISDGTADGTRLLKDLNSSTTNYSVFPIGVLGNRVAILAANALWLSDGTEAGTTIVKQWSSVRASARVVGSKVFVAANDGTSGDELWVSDGTAAGTQRVTDYVQTTASPFGLDPPSLTALGNGVLFYADDGAGQAGTWFSDGTSAGTILISNTARPAAYSVAQGIGYFNTSADLFRTDGTVAGTYRIDVTARELPVSAFGAAYYIITNVDGSSELRRTDGTIGGTSTRVTFPLGSGISSMTPTGGKLYFSYFTPVHGAEPAVSNDGTSVELLVNVAFDQRPSSSPGSMTGTTAGAFFFASDDVQRDAWFSDGTTGGTIRLGLSIPPDANSALMRVGASAFMSIRNSWWKSDGTVAGTIPISFFSPSSGESIQSTFAASDRLYLVTPTGLYVSDGVSTQQLTPAGAPNLSTATKFSEHAGVVYFETSDSRLWETRGTSATTRVIALRTGTYAGGAFYGTQYDGTTNTTSLVRFDTTGASVVLGTFASPSSFLAAGRYVYFVNYVAPTPTLWRTDGTAAGTIQLASAETFAASGETVYFVGSDDAHGAELWRTDGTIPGTTLLKDIAPGNDTSLLQFFTDAWGSFWFTANDGVHGRELWRTDGTEAGTVMVADIAPSLVSSSPMQLTKAGSRLFFTANDGVTGVEPWAIALEGSALSIADVRVTEGNAGTTNMRFTVTREGDLSQLASAAFTTENGSATSGADFVSTTGTVTFGVGESTATIDVSIQNDTITESNETMYVVLSSPNGTTLSRPRALGLIEDNDARVDLALDLLASGSGLQIRVTNNGPSNATGVQVRITDSPSTNPFRTASFPMIAPGSSATVNVGHSKPSTWIFERNVFIVDLDSSAGYTTSATVTSSEEELNPADNTKSAMSNADATVVLPPHQTIGTTKAGSMYASWSGGTINGDALLSITPGSVPATGQATGLTLVAGNVAGSSLVRGNDGSSSFTFHYPIVNPGQTPKLATAASAFVSPGNYGTAIPVKIFIRGARHDGVRPTGIVTVKANGGGVLTQLPLDADGSISFSRSNLSAGTWGHWIEYAGDANFLPMRGQFFVEVNQAPTTITGSLTRTSCYIAEGKLTVKAASGTIAPEGRIAVTFGVNTVYLTLVPTGQPGEAAVMARVQLPSNNTTVMYTYQPAQFSQYAYSATNQTITFADCTSVATALYVMTPCRILDTRDSTMLANYATRTVQAAGRCGIPADARAISGNVTAVSPAENGFLRMLPSGVLPIPDVSTMSYRRGKTRANNTIILLNSDGALDAYNGGPNPVHFIIDVYAYFK